MPERLRPIRPAKSKAATPMQFRLRPDAAPHITGAGQEQLKYLPGETLESHLPLDELFVNKFERLAGPPTGTPINLGGVPERIDPNASKPQVMDDFEHDVTNRDRAAAAARRPAQTAEGDAIPDEEGDPPTGMLVTLGDDVTDQFPKALEGDFKVFKKGRKYFIADEEDTTTQLNTEDITTKDAVNHFLTSRSTG